MRSSGEGFISEKAKQANRPVLLFTIHDYTGTEGEDLNFCDYDQDIVYAGVTYTKFPVRCDFIGDNAQGSINTIKVVLGNVSRLIQSYLMVYDLRGLKVSIKLVFADKLDDEDAYVEDVYYIDSYQTNQQDAVFELTGKFDVLSLNLPGRVYSRNYCSWKFKSEECGYAGAETECNKTLQRCRGLSNTLRFGGFPSIPTSRIYVR
ncbi:hypothetical protein M0R36_04280 [bacterium]|jgi:phage-related protein|nr:hypothetical protein [bacterium]